MKLMILFPLLFFVGNSQQYDKNQQLKDTIYIYIPNKLDVGYIVTDLKQVRDTAAVTYIFGGFSSEPEESFFLDIKKISTINRKLPDHADVLTPVQVLDSLKIRKHKFFREYVFFAVFKRCGKYYLHSCRGEYIHKDFPNDDN